MPIEGNSSESVQCAITGPCLRMRHRPSVERTVPIRKLCPIDSHSETVY